MQPKFSQIFAPIFHTKMTGRLILALIEACRTQLDFEIGPASRPISADSAPNDRQHSPQYWVIVAEHHHAVKRNSIHEFKEGTL